MLTGCAFTNQNKCDPSLCIHFKLRCFDKGQVLVMMNGIFFYQLSTQLGYQQNRGLVCTVVCFV